MQLLRTLATVIATSACLASASSQSRNRLQLLGVVDKPSINTPSHKVNALSTFDLSFDLHQKLSIRLNLEPNHDILPDEGVHVNYLGPDGEIRNTEVIDRLDHKVFRGTSWVQREDTTWEQVGWSRIVIRRDGVHPLFEGAFTINHDHHHIQLRSNYMQTKHALDPDLEDSDEEYMVMFRDSDIAANNEHTELKRGLAQQLSCQSDNLEFNLNPEHPIHSNVFKPSDGVWGVMPVGSMFGKRQLDTQPGGNSAGVNLASTIGQTNGCPNTRKVALVGVATDCTYTQAFPSMEAVRQNIITQMNTASTHYESTFNISLGLQNLTISEAICPGTPPATTPWNQPCSPSVNIRDRLNLFSAWRGGMHDDNSHWTLLSTCNTGSAVGLAWLGQACVNTLSTGNSSEGPESISGANVVVRTSTEWQVIAHETGHTFGAVHDCTAQACSDGTTVSSQQCCPLSSNTCNAAERYIMNPSTADGITAFSPCSIGNICSAMLRNSVKTTCFAANRGVTTITGQQCGNGIVEEGEDCDCGGAQSCGNNACCDATTCKFKNNAVCDDSNEDCCRNCQFAANGTVCRDSTGVCDPQEVCPGNSPTCPADVNTPDGTTCSIAGSNEKNLQCSSGQCTSRDLQCKTVMGGYTHTGNDTYACDSNSCMLSCRSPEFGPNVCYGLQQNFLDGTICGGGGRCVNGACKGASWTGQVRSWILDHKATVIGLAVGLGVLVLFILSSCIVKCCRRPKAGTDRRKPREHRHHTGGWQQPGPPQPQMYQQSSVGGEWYGGSRGSGRNGYAGSGGGGGWDGPMPPVYYGHGQQTHAYMQGPGGQTMSSTGVIYR